MQRRGIGVANLPNQIHNHFIQKGCTFNIMVVGSHGLGKTTFLNQFFGSDILKYQPFECDERSNSFEYLEGVCNIQTSYVEIYEGGLLTRMNITEIDCVGDSVDNTNCHEPIVKFLESNMDDYYLKIGKTTKNLIQDKRVHLCLYFLEPIKFIKITDLEVMKKISKYCIIIPIIAKSDILNGHDYSNIKTRFREQLDQNNIPFFEDKNYMIEAPFLYFSHEREKDHEQLNCKVPNQNFEINEFQNLKRMILEKSIVYFAKETDQFYDNYRVFTIIFQGNEDGIGKSKIEKKIEEYEKKITDAKDRFRELSLENGSSKKFNYIAE